MGSTRETLELMEIDTEENRITEYVFSKQEIHELHPYMLDMINLNIYFKNDRVIEELFVVAVLDEEGDWSGKFDVTVQFTNGETCVVRLYNTQGICVDPTGELIISPVHH